MGHPQPLWAAVQHLTTLTVKNLMVKAHDGEGISFMSVKEGKRSDSHKKCLHAQRFLFCPITFRLAGCLCCANGNYSVFAFLWP